MKYASLATLQYFKEGDHDAFKKIWEEHNMNVWYYVRSKLDSFKLDRAIEVDDIVSDVFLKLYANRATINDPEHIYRFLFLAAVRKMIDLSNSWRRHNRKL